MLRRDVFFWGGKRFAKGECGVPAVLFKVLLLHLCHHTLVTPALLSMSTLYLNSSYFYFPCLKFATLAAAEPSATSPIPTASAAPGVSPKTQAPHSTAQNTPV